MLYEVVQSQGSESEGKGTAHCNQWPRWRLGLNKWPEAQTQKWLGERTTPDLSQKAEKQLIRLGKCEISYKLHLIEPPSCT